MNILSPRSAIANVLWADPPDGDDCSKTVKSCSRGPLNDNGLYSSKEPKEYEKQKNQQVYDSIVKIHVNHSEPNYTMPWQRTHQTTSTSSGFVISAPGIGLRVLTNAHSVEYASVVQVQRRGEERRYEAVMEALGNECDLALLRVDDKSFYGEGEDVFEPPSLEFGPLPALQDKVQVIGYPTGGDSMSFTSGIVSRIERQEYTQAGSQLLAIQIDAAINSGNSGGPVLNEAWKVVGVAFQALSYCENIGYVVPVNVVAHFLEDVRRWKDRKKEEECGGVYVGGFCELGIRYELLENRALRKSLGLTVEPGRGSSPSPSPSPSQKKTHSGIMVGSVYPNSNAAVGDLLLPRDVITSIDAIPIANDGKIPFRHGERVSLECYIQTKFPGDTVKVSLLRRSPGAGDDVVPTKVEANVLVSPYLPSIPAHHNNSPPPYLIASGLVFTELSAPLLQKWRSWKTYFPDEMSYLRTLESSNFVRRKGDRVVVLSHVLAHGENLGYEKYKAMHLVEVDGAELRNLRHLRGLLEEGGEEKGRFVRFGFAPHGKIMVLERESMERVTEEVCREQCITKRFHLPCVDVDDKGDIKVEGTDDDGEVGSPISPNGMPIK